MKCAVGCAATASSGPYFVCKDGPVFPYSAVEPLLDGCGRCEMADSRSRSSRSGSSPPATAASSACSTARTNCCRGRRGRDRVLPGGHGRSVKGRTICRWSKAPSPRRTTPSASSEVAEQSQDLVTIGACATAGGIQALRNFGDVDEFVRVVYATPAYIDTLQQIDADRRARVRWISSCAAARSTSTSCRGDQRVPAGPQARTSRTHSVCVGVQARAATSA